MSILQNLARQSMRCISNLSGGVGIHLEPVTRYKAAQLISSPPCLIRKMAQKTITNFFMKTLKKDTAKKEESNKTVSNENISRSSKADYSRNPVENVEKKSEKRGIQSSDSGSDTAPTQNSPNPPTTPASVNKKTSRKRQRIESSGSESESTLQNEFTKLDKNLSPIRDITSSKNSPKQDIKTEKPKKKIVKGLKNDSVERSNAKKSTLLDVTGLAPGTENGKEEHVSFKKVPEVEYDPSQSKYHPVNNACWVRGDPVPYLALARTLEVVEATSSRLRMVDTLANYLRSVITLTPNDLLPSLYLCLNRLAPAHHGLELGVAETYLMKAIGQCTGRTLAQVKAAAQRTGDLGLVAEQARATQRTMFSSPPLTVRGVLAALRDIAKMTGHASVTKKIGKIQSLYVACRHCEARYLIRSLAGKLRIGLAEQSVLQALAQATATTPPDQPWPPAKLDASRGLAPDAFKAVVEEHALVIKSTFSECPDYEALVPALLEHGVRALPQHCRLTPGVPLKPMLAHPTRGVQDVLQRFEGVEFTCEWKYDGERAQIHVAPELGARIFSRNQEDHTGKYPDVLERLPALLTPGVVSAVLDCEAVAYDVTAAQILPFQVLSTRKRKEAATHEIKVQVCVFVFDLLYLNGRPLVRESFADRRRLLRKHFLEVPGQWQFARGRDCANFEEVAECLDEAVRGSCEGLMVKSLSGADATYEIARRSHNWLKLKKDYLEGAGDSIDAVVIGGYLGRGKRVGAFGGFLLATYDPETESFQSLCKIGTGFSDEDLQTLSAALRPHAVPNPPAYYSYDSAHAPDVWFASMLVWEIRCADLSLSPAHRAAIGLVDPDKGISLRFPRFIRTREDKQPEQATSARQLADMYLAQDQVRNVAASTTRRHTDDFY